MTTEEKIAVMQAFVLGKQIEFKVKKSSNNYNVASSPTWNWDNLDYRIKNEPEYIPFDFSDAENLIEQPIIKKEKTFYMITKVTSEGVLIADGFVHFDYLLKYCKFLNGSICGKLKQ